MTEKERDCQKLKVLKETFQEAITHIDTIPDSDNPAHRLCAILGATQFASKALYIAADDDMKEALDLFKMYRSF